MAERTPSVLDILGLRSGRSNGYVRDRLTQHLKRRSHRPFRPLEGVPYYQQLHRLGLVYL
ncbi:MAG: hypothetical protein EXQ58_12580 [Acidobacteria bacterium]|nr:hypothetical protein [Acidobacteriota bacterium]